MSCKNISIALASAMLCASCDNNQSYQSYKSDSNEWLEDKSYMHIERSRADLWRIEPEWLADRGRRVNICKLIEANESDSVNMPGIITPVDRPDDAGIMYDAIFYRNIQELVTIIRDYNLQLRIDYSTKSPNKYYELVSEQFIAELITEIRPFEMPWSEYALGATQNFGSRPVGAICEYYVFPSEIDGARVGFALVIKNAPYPSDLREFLRRSWFCANINGSLDILQTSARHIIIDFSLSAEENGDQARIAPWLKEYLIQISSRNL